MADISYTMPESARKETENTQGAYSSNGAMLYKPLPAETGSKFTNELYIPLYEPAKWGMFNMPASERARLGLVDDNPMMPLYESDRDVYTYHFKVPVHQVDKFERADGSTGYAQVICPIEFNNYLVRVMGKRPLFKNPSCPFCEAANRAWGEHNARWAELKVTQGIDKKQLNAEGYKGMVKHDPVLKDTYDRGKANRISEKYVLNVFDYSKFSGNRPLAEGENLTHQVWLAPKTVFTELEEFYAQDASDQLRPFFDHNDPDGFQIMRIIKDTTECSGANLRDTKYKVMKGQKVKMDDNWATYLTTLENMSDPSNILLIIPTEEMALYANNSGGDATSYNTPAVVTNPPVGYTPVPPQAPVTPQVPPQVPAGPPMAPQVPVTPQVPPQAPAGPPMAPQAPVTPQVPPQAPAGPPMAPQVPVTPQVPPQAPAGPPTPPMPPSMAPVTPKVQPPPSQVEPSGDSTPDRTPPPGSLPPGMVGTW